METNNSRTKLPVVHVSQANNNLNSSSNRGRNSGKFSLKKLAPLEDINSNPMSSSLNSTTSIKEKKDLAEALRRLNPASCNPQPNIFWDVEGSLKTSVIDTSDLQQQITIVENGVNYNIKRFNDLKVTNERYVKILKQKLDELDIQKKIYENLDSMKKSETEEGLRIVNLQKEIKECDEYIKDRTHYSRKLDHVLSRLKSNQLKFDAHLVGMEETMKAIQKDAVDVKLMRRNLDVALAKATSVCDLTYQYLQASRKDRKILLDQRKQEYANAKSLQEWIRERERMKIELSIELRGDLTLEEEKFLKSQIEERTEKTKTLQKASEESLKKLQAMEEAFTKLKQVTGVKNVEEMHEKFLSQKSSKLQLELEVKDAEAKLNNLKKNYSRLEMTFQELKSDGSGLAEISRDNISSLESALNKLKNQQKALRSDSDRLSNTLLAVQQGAQGLYQRIQPFLGLVDSDSIQSGLEKSACSETIDHLSNAEHVLSKMMETIASESNNAPMHEDMNGDDSDSGVSGDSASYDTMDEMPNQHYNVRIRSHRFREYYFNDEEKDYADDDEKFKSLPNKDDKHNTDDIQDERKGVKKSSISLITAKDRENAERKKMLENSDSNFGKSQFKIQQEYFDKLSTIQKVPTLPDGVTLRDDPMKKTNAFLTSGPKLE